MYCGKRMFGGLGIDWIDPRSSAPWELSAAQTVQVTEKQCTVQEPSMPLKRKIHILPGLPLLPGRAVQLPHSCPTR